MSRPQWFIDLIKKLFPGRFSIAGLTHLPVIGNLIDRGMFEGDDLIYLPRDATIPINQAIAIPEDVVLPSQVLEHFIAKASYHWLMDFCICRASSHCTDYPADLGCLFLGEAVLEINPKFGRLVSKGEALEHVARCGEAGLVHMVGRNKLDTIWLGAGPADKLLTVCNCCPCCCLWKVLPHINPIIANKVHKMPGVSVHVTDLCSGCGVCTEGVCFVDAIRLGEDGRATISAECRACGRCVEACPDGAIEITIEDRAFVQAAIARIGSLVDLT
jgi:ferredoxin